MACDRVVSDLMLPLREEVLWPFLDAWDTVRLRTTSKQWNVPGRYWPCGELFFFLLEKEPMVLRELSRLGPSIRPHGELLLLLMQEKPIFVPECEAFNSYIGDGFLVPEFQDETEASKDEQADSASENNVGNDALDVIGLHGSGDVIVLFFQDWEVAKVASELPHSPGHAVPGVAWTSKGGAAGSASERVLFLARRRRKRMTCPSELRGQSFSFKFVSGNQV